MCSYAGYLLSSRYSDVLNSTIATLLKELIDDELRLAILQEVSSLTLVPAQHQVVQPGVTVMLALNHALVSTRTLAVGKLVTQLLNNEVNLFGKFNCFTESYSMFRL